MGVKGTKLGLAQQEMIGGGGSVQKNYLWICVKKIKQVNSRRV